MTKKKDARPASNLEQERPQRRTTPSDVGEPGGDPREGECGQDSEEHDERELQAMLDRYYEDCRRANITKQVGNRRRS